MTRTSAQRQSGAALLLFMLLVIVATATVLVGNVSRDALAVRQQLATREALELARRALLDYATVRGDRGDGLEFALPCPDIDESGGFADGVAHDSACGAVGVTVAGRLPWRTLGIPALKDAGAACLWYVVSGSWKDAAAETAALINADSNGALQLFNVETGDLIEGRRPQDRPVAMVMAAMRPVDGQTRPGVAAGRQCSPGASADDYLDSDAGTGISNARLSGIADTVELFAMADGHRSEHNDRVASISRAEIAARIAARRDSTSRIRELGLAAAACVANYAANNPGGATDRRMPWPAVVGLPDYRIDSAYDDTNDGNLSGRLPDAVDDSNANTANPIGRVLNDCDALAVPAWNAEMSVRWQHWKDHFFYAIAPSFAPDSPTPSACASCLTVNGTGQYAALLIFAGPRMPGQVRNAPPLDTDTRRNAANYLEAANAALPGVATNYVSGPTTATFNDLLFCISPSLSVTEC